MNASPFYKPHLALLSFCVYRSGIPLLIFLYSLCFLSNAMTIVLVAAPVMLMLDLLVGKRAVEQPFWLLLASVLAVPAAAAANCWAHLLTPDATSLESVLGRATVVAKFQSNLEAILDLPTTCCLLLSFLLLWALASTISSCVVPPCCEVRETKRTRLARLLFLICSLVFCVLAAFSFPALTELRESVSRSGWRSLPAARVASFSHPSIHGKTLLEISPGLGKTLTLEKSELPAIFESLARDLYSRRFQVSQEDTLLLWEVYLKLVHRQPADRGSALLVAATLAHNRHWDLGCTERLTASFRTHTLAYLASANSTAQDLDFFQDLASYLVVKDRGGRERQDVAKLRRRTGPLKLWEQNWNVSLAMLYYALDNRLIPPHEPLEPAFNPEMEALEAVIALRREQMNSGKLPGRFELSPRLGTYWRISSNRAKLLLNQIDPTCRPPAVVEFRP